MVSKWAASAGTPVCLLCLKNLVVDLDEDRSVTNCLFKQFVNLSRVYLKVEHVDKLVKLYRDGSQPFCEACGEEVELIVDLYETLERLRWKLMGKVVKMGEIINKSGKDGNQGSKVNPGFQVELFRKQLANKCDLKASQILPKVVLAKGDTGFSDGKLSQADQRCSKGSSYGNSSSAFMHVGSTAPLTKIPTRETINVFVSLIVVFSCGYGWNLEKILERFRVPNRISHPAPSSSRNLVTKHLPIAKQFSVTKPMPMRFKQGSGRPSEPPKNHIRVQPLATPTQLLPPLPLIKRGPGRPPKKNNTVSGVPQPPLQMKRGPGRPPKNAIHWKSTVRAYSVTPNTNAVHKHPFQKKRGRGRPKRKLENPIIKSEFSPVKRGVGRPPKKKIKLEEPASASLKVENLVEESPPSPSTAPASPIAEDFVEQSPSSSPITSATLPIAGNVMEKVEVDIPSPEPSMIADAFDDAASFDDQPAEEDSQMIEAHTEISPTPPPPTEVAQPVVSVHEASPNVEGIRRLRPRSESQLAKMVEADTEIPEKPKRPNPNDLESRIKKRRRRPLKPTKNIYTDSENSDLDKDINPANDPPSTSPTFGFFMQCPDCPAKFVTLFPFHEHLQNEHSKKSEAETTLCKICDKPFDTLGSLYLHLQIDHEISENKPYFCVYCSESFTTEQMCDLHRRNLHWIFPQNLLCDMDECSETFFSTQELLEHQKSHLCSENEKLYTCEKCNWSFLKGDRFRLHKFSHYEKNPNGKYYKCDTDRLCYNAYRTSFALAAHFHKFHVPKTPNKLKLLYCDIDSSCEMYFVSQKQLDAHKEMHALYKKEIQVKLGPGVSNYSLYCAYCKLKFNEMYSKSEHQKICPDNPNLKKEHAPDKKFASRRPGFHSLKIRKTNSSHSVALDDSKEKRYYPKNRKRSFRSFRTVAIKQDKPQFPMFPSISTTPVNTAPCGFSIRCPTCRREKFATFFPFQEHLVTAHGNPTINGTCSICDKKYDNFSNLFSHLQDQHEKEGEKSHICVYCSESFVTAQMCELHRQNQHWAHPQELLCDDDNCSEKFFSTHDLLDHHKSHLAPQESPSEPSEKEQLFTCEKCNWSFFSSYRLRLHKVNHLERNAKGLYECYCCSRQYGTTWALAGHINNTHITTAEGYKPGGILFCKLDKVCPRYFYFVNQKQLDAHEEIHSLYYKKNPNNGKQYDLIHCLYCREDFNSKLGRDSHEKICSLAPSAEKLASCGAKFTCGQCDLYSTNDRNKMARHQSVHLKPSFKCPQCGDMFHRRDHLKTHISRIHNRDSQLVCHICATVCTSQSGLKYHLTEHEMLHLCPICGTSFSRAYLLKVHMRSHTGERMQCEWCTWTFAKVPQIKAHIQEAHPQEFQKKYGGIVRRRMQYRWVKGELTNGGRRRRRKAPEHMSNEMKSEQPDGQQEANYTSTEKKFITTESSVGISLGNFEDLSAVAAGSSSCDQMTLQTL